VRDSATGHLVGVKDEDQLELKADFVQAAASWSEAIRRLAHEFAALLTAGNSNVHSCQTPCRTAQELVFAAPYMKYFLRICSSGVTSCSGARGALGHWSLDPEPKIDCSVCFKIEI
jgi:hypothetical protein